MRELHLFAGGGGGILGGMLLGHVPVCAVEIEPYCRKALLQRQRDGILPLFPIWDDVRTFDGKSWRGIVDIVCAGFPCQPFSVAGKKDGEDDARNMWPSTARIIGEVGPEFALLENVPGLLSAGRTMAVRCQVVEYSLFGRVRTSYEQTVRLDRYFGRILGDLSELGFDAEWTIVSAADAGAPHLRKRLWILAYATGKRGGSSGQEGSEPPWANRIGGSGQPIPDADGAGCQQQRWTQPVQTPYPPLNAVVKIFRTPNATDAAKWSHQTQAEREEKGQQVRLCHQLEAGGSLNPDWVEWLMGWPIGWTALEPLEMGKFQQWQHSHSEFSRHG